MVKIGELSSMIKDDLSNLAFDSAESGILMIDIENDSSPDCINKHSFDIIFTNTDSNKDCYHISVASLDYDTIIKDKNFIYRKRQESCIIQEVYACDFESKCKQCEEMYFIMQSSSCENGVWRAIYVKDSLEPVEINKLYPII